MWIKYSKQGLEYAILFNKLDKKKINYIFREEISGFILDKDAESSIVMPTEGNPYDKEPYHNFLVIIKKEEDMVHELLHILYRTQQEHHYLIEKETQRILEEEKDLVNYIQKKIFNFKSKDF